MTADDPTDDFPDVAAALAALAASADPRDLPPPPSADAVRLAALEVGLAEARRSAGRWRAAGLASAGVAAAVLVGGAVLLTDAARRSASLAAEVAAVRAEAARGRAVVRAEAVVEFRRLAATQADQAATLARLGTFDDALLDDHLRHGEAIAALRRSAADGAAGLAAVRAALSETDRTAARQFALLTDAVLADADRAPRPPAGL